MVHENTLILLDNLEIPMSLFIGAAFMLTFQTAMTTHQVFSFQY